MMIKNQIFKFVKTTRRRIRSGAGAKKQGFVARCSWRQKRIFFVAGDRLFQRRQVGELRMGLLDLGHESGPELIRHVKARRPFQRVDQHLVFRRLERSASRLATGADRS
jgi:hypothetical protein